MMEYVYMASRVGYYIVIVEAGRTIYPLDGWIYYERCFRRTCEAREAGPEANDHR